MGNCVSCHAPPHFTDFKFHNTGETQDEYDSIHGKGAFAALAIPSLAERLRNPNEFLPATESHPHAKGRFRSVPSLTQPGYTDLGVWNIFANADFSAPQKALSQIFYDDLECLTDLQKDEALSRTLAVFKTSGLRGLALSDPYLHTGRKSTLREVLEFYQARGESQREGSLRNGDPELAKIQLNSDGIDALRAFLDSLNEEYE